MTGYDLARSLPPTTPLPPQALEIMAMNPAVLTCGAKELAAADPAEVRSAAKTRQLLDRFVTPEGLTVAVVIVLLLGVVRLASAPPV